MNHQLFNRFLKASMFFGIMLFTFLVSCKEEEATISNNLKVLTATANGNDLLDGSSAIENENVVIELVLSHSLNTSVFEGALTFSGTESYVISYDQTNSFASLTFANLAFETTYTLNLPAGAYGVESGPLKEDFTVSFTTKAFVPPTLTLASESLSLEEGESTIVTATISEMIAQDVTVNLAFAGSATQDIDYTVTPTILLITAGNLSSSSVITSIADVDNEGEETIQVSISSVENADETIDQSFTISLFDKIPSLKIKGVLSLKIGGTSTNGRAIHFQATDDIADLSEYGIGIANNGGGSDGREIDLPAMAVAAGANILLVRDVDEAGIATYFGGCYDFDHIISDAGINFNGDDPFELYQGTVAVETYGDVELDGTGLDWEYTGSWAYNLAGKWIYGGVDCSASSTTTQTSNCAYPKCANPLALKGVMSLKIGGTATNGRAIHMIAYTDIADISNYGIGIANNGGGSDGLEITFPNIAVSEGDHLLLIRDVDESNLIAYFGGCYNGFDHIIPSDGLNFNGDDPFELYEGSTVIETYGDVALDGTGLGWEYTGAWAYKAASSWAYTVPDCAAGASDNASAACPYTFCQ